MTALLFGLVMLVIGAVTTRREPRRMLNGVLLLAGVTFLLWGIFQQVLTAFEEPGGLEVALFLLAVIGVQILFVLVLACFGIYNGIIMARRESRSLANLLSLLGGLALVAYLAFGLYSVMAANLSMVVFVLFSLAPVGYVAFVFVAFVLYSLGYTAWTTRRTAAPAAVIVLGAGLIGDRVPPLLASRLRRGRQVYDAARGRGADTLLVTSGGQGPDESVAEGVAMARWLQEEGVPSEHLVIEDQSRTTEQNLLFSTRLLAEQNVTGPVAVVTNNYHAFRAATLLRRLDVSGQAVGAPTAAYFWPSATIREFIAMIRDNYRVHLTLVGVLSIPLLVFLIVELVYLLR